MSVPANLQPATGDQNQATRREIQESKVEPAGQDNGVDWHCFTLYIRTADPAETLSWLDRILEARKPSYAFYDGDLMHLDRAQDFAALTEIADRQRVKMSRGQTGHEPVKIEKID